MMLSGMVYEAWVSIGGTRLRTFLATLGIIIGVSSVVILMMIGSGSRLAVEKAISDFGDDLVILRPGNAGNRAVTSPVISLSLKHAAALRTLSPVRQAAAIAEIDGPRVASRKATHNADIAGIDEHYFEVMRWSFIEGGPFMAGDIAQARRVVILGSESAKKLFPEESTRNESLLGQVVRINGIAFTVAGVLQPKGAYLSGQSKDDQAFVPITTASLRLADPAETAVSGPLTENLSAIFLRATSRQTVPVAIEDITRLLRSQEKLRENVSDNFIIRNMYAALEAANNTGKAFGLLLGAVASISLLVGGIGIMNIMLVSVTERTREIGIRKAVGATKEHILMQFLFESVAVTGIGSLIGLTVGFGGGLLAERVLSIPIAYDEGPAMVALFVACIVGIASGLYPAYKAAKLEPIDALRTAGT